MSIIINEILENNIYRQKVLKNSKFFNFWKQNYHLFYKTLILLNNYFIWFAVITNQLYSLENISHT